MKNNINRCSAIFILILILGVGHSWADEITVYVTGEIFIGTGEDAWDNATSTIKVDVRKGHPECFDCNDFNGLYNQDMTNTGYTYNGYPIYSYTLNQAGAQFRFKHYKSSAFKENYTTDWHSTTNQIYQGYYSDAHHWITYGRDVTFYATPEKMDGSKWEEGTHSLFANFKYGDGESEWKRQQMTKTAYTYNGDAIYTCTMLLPYNVIKNVQFLYNNGSDHDLYVYTPSPQLTANDVDGKILLGWNGSHNWVSYGRDVTVYTVPEYLFKDYSTKFSEDKHYPSVCVQYGVGDGEWKTINMDKTDYTYDNYPIWKATFLLDYNIFKEFQIKYFDKTNSQQVGLYQYNQGGNTEYPSSDLDDKLYHGWNGESHDFFPYTYDVKLDQQGGSGGTESIKATDGADLPIATMPGRDGYIFGGYYTVVGGNGDMYYDTNGNSSTQWDSRTITTLYAKWTEHEYAITIAVEGSGTTSPASSTIGKIETPSGDITATPGTGYSFREWDFSKQGESDYDVWCADGYTSTNATIRILAKRDGTLTANFTANNYIVNLENLGATTAGTESVTATYDATLSAITIPTKAHYDFGGYYISTDSGATLTNIQLIDASGNWNTGVSIYTSASKQWIYAGDITLYAKWTEHEYTIALSVSPSEAGTTSPSSSTIGKFVTASGDITASPAAGWKFKEWQFSKTDENYDAWYADGYSSTDATIHINAQHNGTLIAVFEPRYSLVGSLQDDSGNGGMPGWKDYTKTFTVNSSSPVDLTRTCPLQANKTYKLQVHDLATSTNLGRSGCDPVCVLEENASLVMENSDNDVFLYTSGAGEYIFKITAVDGSGHPTLTVLRPYQVNIGRKRVDIDGNDYDDNTGGTVDLSKQTAPETWIPISNGDWVPYGISVKYNASKEDGYTLDWYTASDYATQFSTEPYWFHTATSTGNGYAKFTEIPTTVTLSNDGHGHVEINDETVSSTTVGITTHRELTAVPDEGYKFNSWTIVSGSDITLSSTSTNPTTLSGLGAGAVSGQEVRANFDYRWTLKAESDGWGQAEFIIKNISTNASGDVVGYVDISLSANTNYQFTMYDKQESQTYKNGTDNVYYMTNGNSHNWSFATDKTYNCGITTAGAGTYRFIWNITDKKMTVTYPNFVIYRTGDKADDPRAQNTDVESYDGGTISQAIEFRMRVNRLDYWYTLCLPFEVNAVKVWDEVDGAYYDIVPYWRTEGTEGTEGTYYTGHYILRRPVTTTDFAIEGFEGKDRWIDPESSDVLPSKNIPYIIQWHDSYFQNKYVSFLGAAGQIIPKAMDKGSYASSDETVNIYGNKSMTTGTVRDAYLLDPYYGSDGAWMREEIGTDRSVLPFECFILANEKTTAKYRVLRRDMADNTPTGLDTLFKTEDTASKVLINNRIYIIRGGKMYTIQGTFVKEVE